MPFLCFGGTLAGDCGLGYEDGYPGPAWKQISRDVSEAPEPSVALGRELDKSLQKKDCLSKSDFTLSFVSVTLD